MAGSSNNPLIVERLENENKGIVLIKMTNPSTKNALSKLMVKQLIENLDNLKFDKEARVVILKSDVPGAFCTGADLKERKLMSPEEVPKFVDTLRQMTVKFSSLPIPVIAVVDGYALGGGLEVALSCDVRVAGYKAKMGLTETKLAIIPGAGGTQRLSRIVGPAKAKELILTARIIDGKEGEKIGLVNCCVPNPDDEALEMAKQILKTGPIASKLAKLAINEGIEVSLNQGFTIEQQCYAQVIPTKDRVEALAAFAEKREPIFKGE
ncbi:Methylglutaconyl-CoA hydratase, mitochondrial [Strongyloides ratti]|uniref:Methylglutaconyl-CoA hydratase, mitochondrial n=1 Tax=Strongyloides ratti TaxID=34506 RepID=A0A090L9Y8_STRRB|nr:Methylglutaconyl-CoA hydratase, mitochondrial [Strongyloides ratti]CEF66557.1 Methylglutaconyl-CoA hydratase, mitochondrial [Strongyloides ratti]